MKDRKRNSIYKNGLAMVRGCLCAYLVAGTFSGVVRAVGPDLDADGDVDGNDFLTFANCYNGSNRPPLCS